MSLVRALLAAAAVLLSALASGAAAQGSKMVNMPAEKFIVAPGGVDMRTGRYAYGETDIAIGGEGGLELTRTLPEAVGNHANPFGNFSHNWDIFLIETPPLGQGEETVRANVHQGGRSLTFETNSLSTGYAFRSDGQMASLSYTGDRAAGTAIHTMTGPDGTVILFRPYSGGDCADQAWGTGRRRCAFASEMIEPDGTRYGFDYVATGAPAGNRARLARVTSSRGWVLLLQGSASLVTRACLFNLALGPGPEPGGSCDGALAVADYAYANGKLVSADGPGDGASTFVYGAGTMGFVRPGESQPWLTNSIALAEDEERAVQEIVTRQVFADGQTFDYLFQSAPVTDDRPTPNIAGGTYKDREGRETLVKFGFPVLPNSVWTNYCPQPPCEAEPPWDGFTAWVYQQTSGPIEIVDPLGRTSVADYCDPAVTTGCVAGRLRSSTDPEGIRTAYEYDGRGNVAKATTFPKPGALAPDGSVPAPIVLRAEYDLLNPKAQAKPVKSWDANGNLSTYEYAPEHGGTTKETAPAVGTVVAETRHAWVQRQARRWDGSAAGPPVWLLASTSSCRAGNPHPSGTGCALGSGDEVVTAYDYGPESGPNSLLLRGRSVTADGTTLRTCFAYDSLGRKISETSPMGTSGLAACPASPPAAALPYTASTRYDADGKVTGTIGPDPDGPGGNGAPAVRNTYDAAGRLVRVEQGALAAWQPHSVAPSAWSGFTVFKALDTSYDAMGRKVREVASGGGWPVGVTEYSWDLHGRLVCTAVRMNPDAWAAPLSDTCAPGPAHAEHGRDRIARNVHDEAGQLTEIWEGVGTPLERREALYAYDGNGRRTSLVDARGFRAEMRWDGFGRQSRWIFPSPTTPGVADPSDHEEYRHDAHGNRVWVRKRDGRVLAFEYDALNRMTVKIAPTPDATVRYAWDNRGLQVSAWFPWNGQGVSHVHDGFGRIESTASNMGGVGRTVSHLFDRDGRRTELAFPDGARIHFVRDGLGRMKEAYQGALGDASHIMTSFTYNAAGLTYYFARRSGDATVYGYDPAWRLGSIEDAFPAGAGNNLATFGYNPAGQLFQETRSNNAYAWAGTQLAGGYAANGLNQYTSAAGLTLAYNANGNLTSDGSTTYTYDAENRLISASGAKNATLSYDPLGRLWQVTSAAGTTRFLWDGDELVAEYDGSGALLRRYVHGDADDDPLFWYEGATLTQPRFPHADRQGSVTAVFGGPATAINTYDEYGIPGAGNVGRFQYTGQAWIAELGLYYYKARFYASRLGRFMQTDPIGYEGGINLYAYVGNDPANRIDPPGTNPDCAPQCFRREPTLSPMLQAQRDYVGADYWESALESYRSGSYLKAAGYALLGITGLGMPGSKGGIRFAQTFHSPNFSASGQKFYSSLAGRAVQSVADLANALSSRAIGPESIPVEYVRVDGHMVILNTRTSAALIKAKVDIKRWNLIDKTGDKSAVKRLEDQLRRNNLPPTGSRIPPSER